jgi:protein transport protein SEC61 subunit alpha
MELGISPIITSGMIC